MPYGWRGSGGARAARRDVEAAGVQESINGESEKNFPTMRSQMEEQDPNYCKTAGVSMTDAACRAKIKEELKSNLITVGVVAAIVAGVLMLLIILTFKLVRQVRNCP